MALLLLLLSISQLELCAAFSVGSSSSSSIASSSARGALPLTPRFKLFKARYPLEGGPPPLRLHVAIIVEDISGCANMDSSRTKGQQQDERRFVLFDFMPLEPTALSTTIRLLSGRDVQGKLRERELRFLPRGAAYVAESDATLEDMRGFVRQYPDRLSLVSNSCVSFVDAFVTRHRAP